MYKNPPRINTYIRMHCTIGISCINQVTAMNCVAILNLLQWRDDAICIFFFLVLLLLSSESHKGCIRYFNWMLINTRRTTEMCTRYCFRCSKCSHHYGFDYNKNTPNHSTIIKRRKKKKMKKHLKRELSIENFYLWDFLIF